MLDQGGHLFDVLFSRLGIGPALQAPVPVTLRTVRVRAAKHVERLDIPVVERLLNLHFGFSPFCGKLVSLGGSEIDVACFLSHDVREDSLQRGITTAYKLLQLIAANT